MNNTTILRTASLELLFGNYLQSYDVFNKVKNIVDDKNIFNSFENEYKLAIKNLDRKKARSILEKASKKLYNISNSLKKKGQLRLDISNKELKKELQPYNQYKNRHLWARDVIRQAFLKLMGREPTAAETQMAQSVALLESSYGAGWKGEGRGSNNWGAIQCCKPKNGVCPANTFLYIDTSPQKDGTSKKYSVCFKKYSNPVDGAVDLLKEIFKSNYKNRGDKTQVAAQIGSIPLFSASMYDSSYYQGFGSDREARIRNHVKAMERFSKIISKATGEDVVIGGNKDIIPTEKQIDQYIATRNQPMDNQPKQVAIQNNQLDAEYNQLMSRLFSSDNMDKTVKMAKLREKLPLSRHLVSLEKAPFEHRVRLANILVTAFRNYFDAETSIHTDNKGKVELEVDILGSERVTADALKAVASAVSDVFSKIIKNNHINTSLFINKKSSLPLLESEMSEKCFRKFALTVW